MSRQAEKAWQTVKRLAGVETLNQYLFVRQMEKNEEIRARLQAIIERESEL